MATAHLDGEKIEVERGSVLGTIVKNLPEGCSVAVIRPATQERERTNSLAVQTTAGEVIIEVDRERAAFLEKPGAADSLILHWHDRYAAAFGPFPAPIRPHRKPGIYERGDVILGCGGYDPQRSYLIFSKIRHSADHGADESGGVIGNVVSGRAVLDRWAPGDRITRIEPVISWADTSRSLTTTDLDTPLEDGMHVITRVVVMAQGYTPDRIKTEDAASVEHLLTALEGHRFTVTRAASTHILDTGSSGTEVVTGQRHPRREGTVTVRSTGPSSGGIYIYRQDVQSSVAHSVVGQVVKGIEFVRLAKEGDRFIIDVQPGRIDLLGFPLSKAQEVAQERGFSLHTDASEGSRVVVSQEPATTLEVLKEHAATITTEPAERVVDIELYDAEAPVSCAIFRRLTGLLEHDAGAISLFFRFDDVFLFKPPIPGGLTIVPENTPSEEVPPASLAITNDSRKGSGMVGVRLSSNREFGPTSEPFEGTNIIGRVLEPDKLKKFREKDRVYLREVER